MMTYQVVTSISSMNSRLEKEKFDFNKSSVCPALQNFTAHLLSLRVLSLTPPFRRDQEPHLVQEFFNYFCVGQLCVATYSGFEVISIEDQKVSLRESRMQVCLDSMSWNRRKNPVSQLSLNLFMPVISFGANSFHRLLAKQETQN